MPVMESMHTLSTGMNLSYPYLWDVGRTFQKMRSCSLMLCSRYEEDNIWDMFF